MNRFVSIALPVAFLSFNVFAGNLAFDFKKYAAGLSDESVSRGAALIKGQFCLHFTGPHQDSAKRIRA